MKCGRKTLITEKNIDSLRRLLRAGKQGKTLATIMQQMEHTGVLKVKETTLRTMLRHKSVADKYMPRVKNPLLEEHRKKRLKWAKANLAVKWDEHLFQDEKCFPLRNTVKQRRYNSVGQPKVAITQVHRCGCPSFHVWGFFSATGFGQLVRFDRHLDGEDHLRACSEYVPAGSVLVMDNAPIHLPVSGAPHYSDLHIETCYLEPCSGDVNPIENLWGNLTTRVYGKGQFYSNLDQLWAKVELEFENIMTRTQNPFNLVKSMPNRLKAVIVANGGHTKY